jgi:hypothetical protein
VTRTIFIALLATLAVGTAHAQHAVSKAFLAVLPPVEFDHAYTGKLEVIVVRDEASMRFFCKNDEKTACTYPHGATCTIYMRDDAYLRDAGWSPAIVRRHEIGHCNGWPKEHPGARRLPPLEIGTYYN